MSIREKKGEGKGRHARQKMGLGMHEKITQNANLLALSACPLGAAAQCHTFLSASLYVSKRGAY